MNYDKEHVKKILNQKYGIGAIFNRFIDEIAPLLNSYYPGISNKRINNLIGEQLKLFRSELKDYYLTQTSNAWELSNKKNDELTNRFASLLSADNLEKILDVELPAPKIIICEE